MDRQTDRVFTRNAHVHSQAIKIQLSQDIPSVCSVSSGSSDEQGFKELYRQAMMGYVRTEG